MKTEGDTFYVTFFPYIQDLFFKKKSRVAKAPKIAKTLSRAQAKCGTPEMFSMYCERNQLHIVGGDLF